MSGAGPFDQAFVQNIFVAQIENVQAFEMANRQGGKIVILQVGSRFVTWTYDQVKRFWKPDVPTEPQVEQQPDSLESELSPQRQRRSEEQFKDVTFEEPGWAQPGDGPTQTQPPTITIGQPGCVQQEKEKHEKHILQHDDQDLHDAIVANRSLGKWNTTRKTATRRRQNCFTGQRMVTDTRPTTIIGKDQNAGGKEQAVGRTIGTCTGYCTQCTTECPNTGGEEYCYNT